VQAAAPEPELVAAEPASEPEAVAPESAPEPMAEEPALDVAEEPALEPAEEPAAGPASLDPERARLILDEALDTLGAAHHRPFSRG
jgi:hypothetical protein